MVIKMAYLTERILQIGEGRFLRGFVGRIADKLNRDGADIGIAVVKPRAGDGIIPALNAGGTYKLQIRGFAGSKSIEEEYDIGCITRGLNLVADFDEIQKIAASPDLGVIISNTTEAGIVYRKDTDTFPRTLAKLLYARFSAGLGGPVVLPCELIEENGKKLREYVTRYATDLGYDDLFIRWLDGCSFPNTLVDSIITSGDGETAVCAEPYYLWVIEYDPPACVRKLIEDSGVKIIFTDNIIPYRQRKVAILNGAHTMSVMAGRLCGFETVRDMTGDMMFAEYIKRGIFGEVIPTLQLPRIETEAYARSVAERFRNPYLKHKLKDIAMNSVPKLKARIIPTLLRYTELYGKAPRLLTMAVSALIAYYRTNEANDDPDTLAFIRTAPVAEILNNFNLWNCDLSFLYDIIKADMTEIEENGMRVALKSRCGL
jgi:tagaturonate reductase